jgi:hypothetical protein
VKSRWFLRVCFKFVCVSEYLVFSLLTHYAEAAKEEEAEAEDDDDMDGFQTDDEDEDGNAYDKEMGILAEDGDEADTLTLRKLAEQVC